MPRSAGTTETHDQLSYLASNNWTGRATIKGGNKTSELLSCTYVYKKAHSTDIDLTSFP